MAAQEGAVGSVAPKSPMPKFLLILYISNHGTVLEKDLKSINVCVYSSQRNRIDPRSLLSPEPSCTISPLIADGTSSVRRARVSQGHTWQIPSQTPACTESHAGASGIPTPASLLDASAFLKKKPNLYGSRKPAFAMNLKGTHSLFLRFCPQVSVLRQLHAVEKSGMEHKGNFLERLERKKL